MFSYNIFTSIVVNRPVTKTIEIKKLWNWTKLEFFISIISKDHELEKYLHSKH